MIKQTWSVSDEEKRRIINLHESATKKLYLVSEQTSVQPVQGPGNPNLEIGEDKEYVYFISQPSKFVEGDYVNLKKPYLIYASDGKQSYQCEVTQKDEKNRPVNVKVLTDKILPDVRNDEFLFKLIKQSKKVPQYPTYDYGNEITKNAFLYQGKDDSGTNVNERYFAVTWFDGKPKTLMVSEEGPMYENRWTFRDNNNEINYDELEVGSSTQFNPAKDVFVAKFKQSMLKFSVIIPTLFTSYNIPIGKTPEKPNEIPVPLPPKPVPLGDKFRDNVSMPTTEAILKDPNFIEFKKFVESNDMSKFVFDIQSSASKCTAGFKEANSSNGKWSEDKSSYPDVTIDSQADKRDLGNLNLTRARAQNLKNFLVTNIPKLKDAKFRVVAQGSKGTCGTEENNKQFRRVDLTVTSL